MRIIRQWADEIANKWIIPLLGGKKLQIEWELNRKRRVLGTCSKTINYEDTVICWVELSRPFIIANEEAAIRYLLCHELAHIIHHNHGPEFAALLRQMTGMEIPDDRIRFQYGDYKKAAGFTYKCLVCGHEAVHYKRLFKQESCGICNPYKFDYRYVMVLQGEAANLPPPKGVTYRCKVCGNEVKKAKTLRRSRLSCSICHPGVFDPAFEMFKVDTGLPSTTFPRPLTVTMSIEYNPRIEHYISGDTEGWLL